MHDVVLLTTIIAPLLEKHEEILKNKIYIYANMIPTYDKTKAEET